ncbi:lipocalin family protein [Psychroserpens sp. AS72]|uniref:lipocalin family protein n=1 Tax=Psychroserpens sp. AS72 TaxID=3135775 RepID=UPI00317A6382
MKKLILLFSVIALTFTSCGSDDDSGSGQDQFIGFWKYTQYLEDGVVQELDLCEDLDTILISANGTYNSKGYYDYGDGCELDYDESGTWENLGSGNYSSTSDGDTYVVHIEFSGNQMFLDEVYEGVTYRDVYTRQ